MVAILEDQTPVHKVEDANTKVEEEGDVDRSSLDLEEIIARKCTIPKTLKWHQQIMTRRIRTGMPIRTVHLSAKWKMAALKKGVIGIRVITKALATTKKCIGSLVGTEVVDRQAAILMAEEAPK